MSKEKNSNAIRKLLLLLGWMSAPRDYAEVDKKCVCVKKTMLSVIFNIFSAFERAK